MASNRMIKGVRLMVRTELSQREIAKELNVTENTVSNWKKHDEYQELRYAEERAYLGSLSTKAIKALDELVSGAESESVRLQASQDILNRVGHVRPSQVELTEAQIKKMSAEADIISHSADKLMQSGQVNDLLEALMSAKETGVTDD